MERRYIWCTNRIVSVKAQPVDWTFGKKKPFLHIGLPCEYYTLYSPSKAYPKRTIDLDRIGPTFGLLNGITSVCFATCVIIDLYLRY